MFMGIKFSKSRTSKIPFEIEDPTLFALTISGVTLGVYAILKARATAESRANDFVPFSDFWQTLHAPGAVDAVTLHSGDGGTVASFSDSAGRVRFSEIPSGAAVMVTDKALSSRGGIRLSADTGVIQKQLAVIGELFGYGVALLGVAMLQKMMYPQPASKPKIDFSQAGKSFNDVAGLEGTKTELKEIVEYLKSPETFYALGARPPKGVLLEGPSGTGKTLLGRAIAGEAGVEFFYVAASQFIEIFVGQGARAVREVFQQARAHAPCVVFIDELDAIGVRMAGGAGSQEHVQTINQLLVELDGINGSSELVVVMAATNRFDSLDEALVRPGRFDRLVHVGYPDEKAREHAFRIHSRNIKLASDVDMAKLARMTDSWTGADIEATLNTAALASARAKKAALDMGMILHTINDTKRDRLQRRARANQAREASIGNIFTQMFQKQPDVSSAD